MFNTRPLDDPRIDEARQKLVAILEEYDLAGAVCVIGAEEWGYVYKLPASWSAVQADPLTPLGLRIRAKQAEIGREAAHAKLEAAAHTFCALGDFGAQTYKWANDFVRLLQEQGLEIEHRPHGGAPLGDIRAWRPHP